MTVQGYNPRTGQPYGDPLPVTSDTEVDRLCEAAHSAHLAWSGWTAEARARVLDLVADRLDGESDALIAVADAETALGVPRLTTELKRTTNQLRMFADVLREGSYVDAMIDSPNTDIIPPRPDVRRVLRPLGVIAVFSASNFPFALSTVGSDTASALAAGCSVVVKGHSAHPNTTHETGRVVTAALSEGGAPDGLFSVVYGTQSGIRLVQHPVVKAAGFTGSIGGGRALYDLANSRPDPIPFYGELGSVNPTVVLPAAAAERPSEIAAGFAQSVTMGVGQFCTNPGLVFAPSSIVDELGKAVTDSTGGAMLNERMCDSYRSAVDTLSDSDLVSLVATGSAPGDAWAGKPALFSVPLETFEANLEKLTEENFGPSALVVTYSDVADVLPVLSRLPGTLTGTVHAQPSENSDAAAVADELRKIAGRLIYNGWPTGIALAWAMQHGGPWPATTNASHTSIGVPGIYRWLAPVTYQTWPDELLPPELQNDNPLGITRRRDGVLGKH
ncbi:aldehyde dehydrogenase (NADP(+)) [Kibdelosporangium phytohabitans]|uniref:Aldehyde dehydrogenase n=1 Tax=Kibdelosporangium phytohabitans TaxID=860235 RepID=A0A0N9HMJ1_9PSEU|nr:aldehyde dehydrogenase (NADP(+)) [Kibdelosporangium phytohabitans]ALG07960.1 aldehyde dehydrogenase [Kibdelosporangium phytohabitans]MBE1471096.1 NADP-dependent aldehyde dehydrogenase [Kibdelosporangium phytohabitans]